jgi:hypothetical protein
VDIDGALEALVIETKHLLQQLQPVKRPGCLLSVLNKVNSLGVRCTVSPDSLAWWRTKSITASPNSTSGDRSPEVASPPQDRAQRPPAARLKGFVI